MPDILWDYQPEISADPQKGTKRKVGHPNSGTIGTVGTAPLLLHTHTLMYITS